MIAIYIFLIAFVFLNDQAGQSFEKQAVTGIRQVVASSLDASLPQRPFGEWLEKLVGPGNQIVWQLSECGDSESAIKSDDPRACVEADTILKDGRRVIIMIAVGSFKKGANGPPTFDFGVVERDTVLYPVRRLRDLPTILANPTAKPAATIAVIELPQIKPNFIRIITVNILELGALWPLQFTVDEADEAPRPPPAGSKTLPVVFGAAITKVQPRYPASARKFKLEGSIDVQITISTNGHVTQAKAINCHPLLCSAAEDAARQWIFQPATLQGIPVETQTVLTFVFKAPQ